MNVNDYLNRLIQPLRGPLRIDAFMDRLESIRRDAKAPESTTPLKVETAAAGARGPVAAEPREERRRNLTDTGRLRLEVLEFMNRENPSRPDADEITEFMQERGGFDPSSTR